MERIKECDYCRSDNLSKLYFSEDHFSGDKFSIVECGNCGLIITDPRPSNEELEKYYPNSYYGENGNRFLPLFEYIVQLFRKRLAVRISNKYPNRGRILEIGSGRGTLLKEMSDKGWESIGTEFSGSLSDSVEKIYGIRIYPTPKLSDCNFPDDYFNVILCYHVFEHLTDPFMTLVEIKRILHPSGMLLIAVPNIGGSIARLSKGHWFANDTPRHLFHFTPETLTAMLENEDFKIISKSTLSLEQDIFGFSQSIQNIIGFPYNIFYDFIRSQTARLRPPLKSDNKFLNYVQQTSIFVFGSILCLIGIPIALISALLRMGGTIEIWAKLYDHT